ncbi:unnamed protein product, partial [Strongylus vulgaris]
MRQLSDVIKISDAVESDTIHTYYTLDAEVLKQSGTNRKLTNVAEQARKLRPRMQAMYDVLSETNNCPDCSGHSGEDNTAAEEMFMSFLQNSSLDPISDVAPCAYDGFIANLHSFLVQCTNSCLEKGVLYSANTPILRFPKRTSPMKARSSDNKNCLFASTEENLRTVSQHLDNILFPVLAGDDMVVCGSEQRKETVVDFVDK